MISSINDMIVEGEDVIETAYPSRYESRFLKVFAASMIYTIILSGILLYASISWGVDIRPMYLLLFLPALLYAGFYELKRKFVMYHFTDERVVEERGVLNKELTSLDHDNITDIHLEKDFEERIFDVGDLLINTAGSDGREQALKGLRDPESFRVLLKQEKERKDRDPSRTQRDGSSHFESELEDVEKQMEELQRKSRGESKLTKDQMNEWYRLKGRKKQILKEMEYRE